ncbi:Transcriptional regulator of ribosomal biogenesis proteins [Physocladia obscura]|uniref:Transcriptional regulator of ribosomal biogenesis proteins n=1 Tax=Physocladia obscura TaxID=109957 RepID=A0AAD5T229_9FUNG|nr:Transcriptional regulator of ribosomal biogenesis proteins [Physocladia obscura]
MPFLSPRLRAVGSRSRSRAAASSRVGSYNNHMLLASAGSVDKDSIMAMALYSRSPLLASSPSRDLEHVAGLTDAFCKDFICCGINMDNLHDLLQHFEEYHAASSNTDSDSEADALESDILDPMLESGASLRQNQLWNSFGRNSYGRNRTISMDGNSRGSSSSRNRNNLRQIGQSFIDDKDSIVEEYGGHLPFAFESYIGGVGPSSISDFSNPFSATSIAANPEVTPSSASAKQQGSIPSSLSFASRMRSGVAPLLHSNSSLSSAGNSSDANSLFTANMLSSSLGALSVSGINNGGIGPANIFRNELGGSVTMQSNAGISTIPSPSNSIHTMTPPPLHHEVTATSRPTKSSPDCADHNLTIATQDNGVAKKISFSDSEQISGENDAPDNRRRGSHGQLVLKRKVGDNRMEIDDDLSFLFTQVPQTQSQDENNSEIIFNSCGITIVGAEDPAASKKRIAQEISEFVTDDASGVNSNSPPLLPTAAILNHFRKRSLLSSASFSPSFSPPRPKASELDSLDQPFVKFNKMSPEAIESFQQMTPQQQQDFIINSLEPDQISLLLMMVNQASIASVGAPLSPISAAATMASLTIENNEKSNTSTVPHPVGSSEVAGASVAASKIGASNSDGVSNVPVSAPTILKLPSVKVKHGKGQKQANSKGKEKAAASAATASAATTSPATSAATTAGAAARTPLETTAAAATAAVVTATSSSPQPDSFTTGDSASPPPSGAGAINEEPDGGDDSDDRPFKCHLCDKTYKNPGGIKYHLKHTHGVDHVSFSDMSDANRPYMCTVEGCGKRYKNLNGLKKN